MSCNRLDPVGADYTRRGSIACRSAGVHRLWRIHEESVSRLGPGSPSNCPIRGARRLRRSRCYCREERRRSGTMTSLPGDPPVFPKHCVRSEAFVSRGCPILAVAFVDRFVDGIRNGA